MLQPGANITVDEQLFPTKARCKFTQYMANKPDKFGIQFWLAVNPDLKYLLNGFPYLGKDDSHPADQQLTEFVVLRLVKPFMNKGPDYWGLLNPEWKLCNKGRRQSPVDIDPSSLLFDPGLGDLHVDKHKVNGTIRNTGHSVLFRLDPNSPSVTLHGGPLSYKYRVHEILLHYGRTDDRGSEHTVSSHAFPAELQVVGYNYQLYENVTDALPKTQGIVTVTLMLKLGNLTNSDLRLLTSQLDKIIHKGQKVNITNISVRGLLPDTSQFMTYEGSTTMPGCHETVTWIILNKPVYISKAQIFALRRLMQGDEKNPKTILANNFRPPQPLYNRSVRTNIVSPNLENSKCFTERKVSYKGNIVERAP